MQQCILENYDSLAVGGQTNWLQDGICYVRI